MPSLLYSIMRPTVKVQVILDKSNRTEKYSSADLVQHAGIPIFIDAKHQIAHKKIIIIDGQVVRRSDQSRKEALCGVPALTGFKPQSRAIGRIVGAGAKTPSVSGWRSPSLLLPSSPSKARILRMFSSPSPSQVSFPE